MLGGACFCNVAKNEIPGFCQSTSAMDNPLILRDIYARIVFPP
ncbi:hypothetical protein HMPREF9104_02230 [Lentilactobacillus kisonensis F0435]|uniref:Uncharacterized protein n=1 Tax=Lentilactobacillus kisonensis F0435 TaxID=797516 RepID=H1LHY9_9LACO|nr:hypothetical protein HMPREF9104_02230 [Lentilactobacillus kisonensis F0435]